MRDQLKGFRKQQRQNKSESDLKQDSSVEVKANSIMEDISKPALVFICFYLVMLLPSMKEMINEYKDEGIEISASEYLPVIPGILFSVVLHQVSKWIANKLFDSNLFISPLKSDETADQRLMRVGNYIYGTIYYTLSFGTLFYFTVGTNYCPKMMGGSLNIANSLLNWPDLIEPQFKTLYNIALGHHIERAIHEVAVQSKSRTFFTMIFHHMLTIILIFLSSFMGYFKPGIALMLTHDINDIFLNACRLLREIGYKNAATGLFVVMGVSWIFTRLVVYNTEILFGIVSCFSRLSPFMKKFYFSHIFYPFSLTLLLGLNIFWSFQIIQVGISRIIKKEEISPFEKMTKKSK